MPSSLRPRRTRSVVIVVFLLALLRPFQAAALDLVETAPPDGPYPYTLTEEALIPFPVDGRLQHNNHSYFVLEDAYLVAYALEMLGNASWQLDLNTSVCKPADGWGSSGSSDIWAQSFGSEWKELASIDDERLLVYCGPNLVLVNATNGSVIATQRFADGELVLFHASTSQYSIMVQLAPSGRIASFDLRTLRELWALPGDPNVVVTLLGGANAVAVVVDLFEDNSGAVHGFDAFTGRLLWNVSMPKWGSTAVVYPIFSDSIFAWYGPNFASVRTIYLPTGAYWQYIAPFHVQLMRPTNGCILAASVSSIVAVSVINRTVLWERTVSMPIFAMRLSADGGYVIVHGDPTAGLPALALSMADGSVVGDCDNAFLCAIGMPSLNVVLLLNCSNGMSLRAVDAATGGICRQPAADA